jgi:hypothetical protein
MPVAGKLEIEGEVEPRMICCSTSPSALIFVVNSVVALKGGPDSAGWFDKSVRRIIQICATANV